MSGEPAADNLFGKLRSRFSNETTVDSREHLEQEIEKLHAHNEISEKEYSMLEGILDFQGKMVREVMVPRTDAFMRAYDVNDSRRMPLYLLNNMLGGPGMNAKLNLALREHNGLVYTVESTMVAYGDTGIWSIYFGCDEHDVKRCLRLVRKELDKFMQKPLSEAQLKAAKKQIKGQVGVACDNRENFALDFGKSFLHYGWEKNVDRLYEQVDEITAEQIQAVAQELFDKDRLTTLIFR